MGNPPSELRVGYYGVIVSDMEDFLGKERYTLDI
jgi:hypothetical protein